MFQWDRPTQNMLTIDITELPIHGIPGLNILDLSIKADQ